MNIKVNELRSMIEELTKEMLAETGLSRPCSAHDITWGKKGYHCMNCGATAEHSWDIKHEPQPGVKSKLKEISSMFSDKKMEGPYTVYVKTGRLAGKSVMAYKNKDTGVFYYQNPDTATPEPIGGAQSVDVYTSDDFGTFEEAKDKPICKFCHKPLRYDGQISCQTCGKTQYHDQLDNSYELYYDNGGHGGPHKGEKNAMEYAVNMLLGSRTMRMIEVRPRSSKEIGGFGLKHQGSIYLDRKSAQKLKNDFYDDETRDASDPTSPEFDWKRFGGVRPQPADYKEGCANEVNYTKTSTGQQVIAQGAPGSVVRFATENAELIQQMRDWAKDCQWKDITDEHDIDELSDEEVLRGVQQNYEGGIQAFIRDGDSKSEVPIGYKEGYGYVSDKDMAKDPKHIKGERWRIKFQSDKDLKKHGNTEKSSINEVLRPATIQRIEKMMTELGLRPTAIKLVDTILANSLMGLTSADLPDTATFANGLDGIEEALGAGDVTGAVRIAAETAREMVREEGGEGIMEADKVKPAYYDQIRMARQKAKREKNVEAMAYYESLEGKTVASVPFETFKGSWAYEEWLKNPKTQEKIKEIQDDIKRFSYMGEETITLPEFKQMVKSLIGEMWTGWQQESADYDKWLDDYKGEECPKCKNFIKPGKGKVLNPSNPEVHQCEKCGHKWNPLNTPIKESTYVGQAVIQRETMGLANTPYLLRYWAEFPKTPGEFNPERKLPIPTVEAGKAFVKRLERAMGGKIKLDIQLEEIVKPLYEAKGMTSKDKLRSIIKESVQSVLKEYPEQLEVKLIKNIADTSRSAERTISGAQPWQTQAAFRKITKTAEEILKMYDAPVSVKEVAPKGWEGTVKAMKKSGEVENPWALSHWMKGRGMKSHKEGAVNEGVSDTYANLAILLRTLPKEDIDFITDLAKKKGSKVDKAIAIWVDYRLKKLNDKPQQAEPPRV